MNDRRLPARHVRVPLLPFATIGVLLALSASAAEDEGRLDRWVPAFELGFDAQFDDRKAAVGGNVAEPVTGKDTSSIAVVRFGTELLTPRITKRWGSPRAFVSVGGQFTLVDKEVLSTGDPTVSAAAGALQDAVDQQNRIDMGGSQSPGSMLLGDLDPDAIEGEGAYVRIRHNVRPTWYASLGAAWQVDSPLSKGWIRIKPSIEYTADEFRYDGFLADVSEPAPDVFQLTQIRQGRRIREHRLGPGIELEAALIHDSPVTVSVFFASRFLFLVSDRYHSWGDPANLSITTYDDANDAQPTPSTGESVHFTSKSERFLVRFGGGFRIGFPGLK